MALHANTVWEIRTTGSQTNGGGFYNRVPGTSVDYSQQDSPQLTLTDLATDAAGTGLYSATGGFTAAMVGNIIYISGGTLTAGWYEITSYTDTNNVTIDRTAGASKSGGTGNVGGAFKIGGTLDDEFCDTKVAGNTIYIKSGTYTFGEAINCAATGSAVSPIKYIGYNTTRGDNPTGTDRPLIQCGSYSLTTAQYHFISNLRFTGSYTSVLVCNAYSVITNCESICTSGSSSSYAFYSASTVLFIKCVGKNTNGYAFSVSASASKMLFCRAYDSNHGAYTTNAIGCIITGCTGKGMIPATNEGLLLNNIVYNCSTGIDCTNYAPLVINNIITNCTVGIYSSSDKAVFPLKIKNNCLYNTTDCSNVTVDDTNLLATNPLLTDPANNIFTLQSSSPCIDAGMQPDSMIGL